MAMLNENGYDEKGLSAFEKIRTYLMVNIQTMTDHSASNIAAMLIRGSSMGITEAVQKLNRYEGETEKDIRKLMEELKLTVIRGNISEIKTLYLGSGTTKGVDADIADAVTEENLEESIVLSNRLRRKRDVS